MTHEKNDSFITLLFIGVCVKTREKIHFKLTYLKCHEFQIHFTEVKRSQFNRATLLLLKKNVIIEILTVDIKLELDT